MKHPHFTMSKFATDADLYKAKAEYFQCKYDQLEALAKKIIEAHHVSSVDWDCMRETERLLNEDNS